MAYGVSTRIQINGAELTTVSQLKISPIENDGVKANPPSLNGTQPSAAMYAYQNQYRDFAFQKICPPMYGKSSNCVARITGQPANEPDYVADVHFIGIMRAIDDMLQHRYEGTIVGSYSTVNVTKSV